MGAPGSRGSSGELGAQVTHFHIPHISLLVLSLERYSEDNVMVLVKDQHLLECFDI